MAIGEAEAFSERMKRELVALESANVYALMETESVVEEVLQGLEVASICVEDMDEWLGIFNTKLRHMREDIKSVCLLSPLLMYVHKLYFLRVVVIKIIFPFNA